MIKEGLQPLDSLRIIQNAVQAPCYICGEGNNYDAELCRECLAPMALAHQAATQKVLPRMVATIGASGAGKTVYLGMLMDMLARLPDRLQMLARGAFSLSLQQTTASSLARGEFPAKTPSEPDRWNWVHCQVRSADMKTPLELIMPDLAGEALVEEIDHPRSYEVIHPFLEKCAGVLVLIDAVKLQQGSVDQDYFAMKLLSYLAEIDRRPKEGWPRRPIAFVLTKADECEECFTDPTAFARNRAPGFWQQCGERFQNFRFFAAGVAGGCAYRLTNSGRLRVPLRIEPRGIIEPFEWLVRQIKK